ncbi:MAG: bifunctional precorrin-2 dehydrogenase/sirohydrochlorin ferrochelatase [SAR202 cluster bacterium]|nr:bifunctional precorrin-2 dehydrogenase/sirohydrochlorin ferrochelatase [SAR202 cluster bacterium]
MPAYYPVYLDVRDRRCVVFGGGHVGEDKVLKLLEYGAQVDVISQEVTTPVAERVDGKRLRWIERKYRPGDLEGALIAIVADTRDNAMNAAVSEEAKQRNVPLNVADVTHLCTWIAPAVVKRGEVIVAVSTGGASPALARKFREELTGVSRLKTARHIMDLADLAPLLADARSELARKGIKLLTDHWQACLTDNLIEMVQSGRYAEARAILMEKLLQGAVCDCTENKCKMWEALK